MNRSYLFVPGDSEKKFSRAAESGADAVIIDLEDAVSPANKAVARSNLPAFLGADCGPEVWVRINPLDTDASRDDLEALSARLPAGIVLPKSRGATDIRRLDAALSSIENTAGVEAGRTRVLPLVTERPEALFGMGEYASEPYRLEGLTWGAEDLAAALGALANKDSDGHWLPPYELARSLCLVGAAAAGVPAVETVYTDIRDMDGLSAFARAARRDGFGGMLLIHPAQIEPVNEAFTPTAEELEHARRIVELFDADPAAGVAEMDGRMIDRPHYLQARRLLDVADRGVAR
jgi:citrate lyase subunit beta/citryl-CoA lyase